MLQMCIAILARNSLVLVFLFLLAPCGLSGRKLQQQDLADPSDNGGCTPGQVHLALTGDPTQMRVMWKTSHSGCVSTVHFGKAKDLVVNNDLDDGGLPLLRDGSVSTYTSDDMCGAPARDNDFDPPNLHTVVLDDLDPSTTYYYKVTKHGETNTFESPPKTRSDEGFTFIVYGDMGESEHHKAKSPGARATADAVKDEVVKHGAQLVYHVGDVAYANGSPAIWETFMALIDPYAKHAPYMVTVGNHEYDYMEHGKERHMKNDPSGATDAYDPSWGNFGNDSGGECGVAVSKRFIMPGAPDLTAMPAEVPGTDQNSTSGDVGDGSDPENHKKKHRSNSPFWYAFDYGSVHFTSISTEHDLSEGSDQYEWLRRDLESVDKCKTPWLVIGMHRPIYVVYPHKSNRVVGDHLQKQLERLYEEFEVDIVFTGHVHAYARTCNVFEGKCISPKDGGMTHVTIGSGGHKLSEVEHEQPDWLADAHREFGYGRVKVHSGDSMTFEFVTTKNGEVKDSVTLSNQRHLARNCGAVSGDSAPENSTSAAAPTTPSDEGLSGFVIQVPSQDSVDLLLPSSLA